MASFSTLRFVYKWLFIHNNWKDPKYQKLLHPLISSAITSISLLLCIEQIDKIQTNHRELNISQINRYVAAIMLLLYLAIMIIARFVQNGNHVLYETLWACNMALLASAYGLIKNRSWIVSASMIAVSVDQILWYVDLIGYFTQKKFPIGVANYLVWPQTTKIRIFTSFHHIFFIPICFYYLKNQESFPISDWISSCSITFILSILARLFTPHSIDTNKEIVYLNINLSRELWKDVKIKSLQIADGANWYYAIPFGNSLWNTGNLLGYLILNAIFIGFKMIRY